MLTSFNIVPRFPLLTPNSSNTCIAFNLQFRPISSRVVLFHNTRSKDSRPSNGRFMYAMNRLAVRTQPIFHRKVKRFHWTIQIGFDSFLLKLKSHKIKCSFLFSTNAHLNYLPQQNCLSRELISA